MKLCMKAVVLAVATTTAAAGCGGEESSAVANDVSKDEKLLKAMGGYMEKRQGAKPAARKVAP